MTISRSFVPASELDGRQMVVRVCASINSTAQPVTILAHSRVGEFGETGHVASGGPGPVIPAHDWVGGG